MRARARICAEGDGRGGTRLAGLRSQAPLVLRSTPEALYLVGGAGGPLGGDELFLAIEVGPGAVLTVRTAAASVALPGPGPSSVGVRASVAAGGELRWLPEPVIVAQGCDHHLEAVVALEGDARLVWREELILGRHGEAAGSVLTRARVDIGGAALLRHELALGPLHPASSGPAVTDGARAVGSVLLVNLAPTGVAGPLTPGATAAILRLPGPAALVMVLADDGSALRHQLDAGMGASEPHTSGVPAP